MCTRLIDISALQFDTNQSKENWIVLGNERNTLQTIKFTKRLHLIFRKNYDNNDNSCLFFNTQIFRHHRNHSNWMKLAFELMVLILFAFKQQSNVDSIPPMILYINPNFYLSKVQNQPDAKKKSPFPLPSSHYQWHPHTNRYTIKTALICRSTSTRIRIATVEIEWDI